MGEASDVKEDVETNLRVVSLLSAGTEAVFRLGMADALVGRSHECDYPMSAHQLPCCSDAAIDASMPSVAIDSAVREHAAEGRPVYRIHADRLAALAPSVIITQNQCHVCAVSEPLLREAMATWLGAAQNLCQLTRACRGGDAQATCSYVPKSGGAGPASPAAGQNGAHGTAKTGKAEAGTRAVISGVDIVSLEPYTLEDVYDNMRSIAAALGVPGRGEGVVRQMQRVLEGVRLEVDPLVAELGRPRRVACLEWNDPLMGCGHWHPQLIEAAGGQCVTGDRAGRVEVLSLEQLAAADPEVIVFVPCGYDLERGARELLQTPLLQSDGWRALPAVEAGRVHLADGNAYFNRSGPRVVQSAEIAAEMTWPELRGRWGHHGESWLPVDALPAWLKTKSTSAADT